MAIIKVRGDNCNCFLPDKEISKRQPLHSSVSTSQQGCSWRKWGSTFTITPANKIKITFINNFSDYGRGVNYFGRGVDDFWPNSHGRRVIWPIRQLADVSFGRSVNWPMCHLADQSDIPSINALAWSGRSCFKTYYL